MSLGLLLVTAATFVLVACATGQDSPPPSQPPEEFAASLVKLAVDGDWAAIQPLLVDEFQDFDLEALRLGVRGGGSLTRVGFSAFGEPEEWRAEEFGDAVIVRSVEKPMHALTLHPVSGAWRLDPGPYALALVEHFHQEGTGGFNPRVLWDVPVAVDLTTDLDGGDGFQLVTAFKNVEQSSRDGDRAVATLSFNPFALEEEVDTRIPLDSLRWSAGDEEGQVQVVWTTAIVEGDALFLTAQGTFWTSFAMEGVPEDVGSPSGPESVTLHYEVEPVPEGQPTQEP